MTGILLFNLVVECIITRSRFGRHIAEDLCEIYCWITVVGITEVVLICKRRFIGIRIAAVIIIEFVVYIPTQTALRIGVEFMSVDKGGNRPFLQAERGGISLYHHQALIIIPRVDLFEIGLRCALETAARACLMCIAEVIHKQMLVIQLRVEGRLEIHLRVIDVVDVVQHILPCIGRSAVVARQREVILHVTRIVDLDVPVRILVAPLPANVVAVAAGLAAVVLLRLHDGVRTLDIAVEVFGITFHTEVERVVLIRLVTADQTYICRISVIAQTVVLEIGNVGRESGLYTLLGAVDRHDIALASVETELSLAHCTGIGTQKDVLVGQVGIVFCFAPLRVE